MHAKRIEGHMNLSWVVEEMLCNGQEDSAKMDLTLSATSHAQVVSPHKNTDPQALTVPVLVLHDRAEQGQFESPVLVILT